MVLFGVVNDDIVEVGEVDFAAQVLYELAAEFMIDGICLLYTSDAADD